MFLKINNAEFKTEFSYETHLVGAKHRKSRHAKVTKCKITEVRPEGEADQIVAEGEAILGEGDRFQKVVGRKIAFSRAVDNFPRVTRVAFWEEYKRTHRI